jgi:epoxyqueuosine reductase
LTIEHRSSIASELRPAMSTMVYGCDICQEVCPYNARAPERQVAFPGLGGDDSPRRAPALAELIELRAGGYRRLTRGSAMNRARRRMLKRNAIIAAGNSGIAEAELSRALADDDPGIREAAAWALAELGATSVLRARLAEEDDRSVRAAITTLLSRPSDRERER